MKNKLIHKLSNEISQISLERKRGWSNYKKMNEDIINILKQSDNDITDTESVFKLLRKGGMALKNEKETTPRIWRTKTMQKINYLLGKIELDIGNTKTRYLLDSSDSSDMDDTSSNIIESILTISQLNSKLKTDLESGYSNIKVQGEITGKSNHNGNIYLYLKDGNSRIKAVIWKSVASRLDNIDNGIEVIATGKLTIYLKGGEYQLNIYQWIRQQEGDESYKFNQLKLKLEKKGYFNVNHKQIIPRYPMTIGIISSPEAAGFRDMVHKILSLNSWVKIILSPCSVQGRECPNSLVYAYQRIKAYSEQVKKIDIIIIGRGGGSKEDLIGFNDETVVETIYSSNIPIVTGIGHERDTSLSDLAADIKAITPTAAAELVTPNSSEITEQLGYSKRNLFTIIQQKFIENENTLGKQILSIRKKKPQSITNYLSTIKKDVRTLISQKIQLETQNMAFIHHKNRTNFKGMKNIVRSELDKITGLLNDKFEKEEEKLLQLHRNISSKNPSHVLKSGYIALEDQSRQLFNAHDTKNYIIDGRPLTLILQDGSSIRVTINQYKI